MIFITEIYVYIWSRVESPRIFSYPTSFHNPLEIIASPRNFTPLSLLTAELSMAKKNYRYSTVALQHTTEEIVDASQHVANSEPTEEALHGIISQAPSQ